MTETAGVAALEDDAYFKANCRTIMENRTWTTAALENLGFTVLPSSANFVFAKSEKIDGGELYAKLKDRGILVRHFGKKEICDFNRITIGTKAQMETLVAEITKILEG